ncbi:DUF2513 domain-containing protein [Pseudophaeobacter flagellatus]|uniref:DUF2513 domain-containing protein n=1 Tax=Pseudophaeobacter flagellatus TaxID=2899119 RepID=UPI001E40AD98|nr:DUF2513 domain-containing protein [Pseudophaeobacter flagellatus]MCD9148080.1 DUF2513 domain-containing protein [Pseudophaeobacter flagellatus]
MKRNDDLLRDVLFEFEGEKDWLILLPETGDMSERERIRMGHVRLLCDACFVAQVGNGTYRLTNSGHDYLDAIRDEGIWEKTKKAVAETGGSAGLELVKKVATAFVKKKIEDHTGLEL